MRYQDESKQERSVGRRIALAIRFSPSLCDTCRDHYVAHAYRLLS